MVSSKGYNHVKTYQQHDAYHHGDTQAKTATEMEYWASAASMLAEEFWQIAEGFVEVPVIL